MDKDIKYPFRVGVEKITFFDKETAEYFFKEENFDEVYNVFLVELDALMFKWKIKHLNANTRFSQNVLN